MPSFIASNIFYKIIVAEDIKISFNGYDTYAK